MRNIHYILMALLIICGCDKSSLSTNDTEYTNQYIFFDAGVESTKGTLVTGTALPSAANTSFGVFAYRGSGSQNTPVFDMYNNNIAHLYRPAERANFKYDKLAMWTAGEYHSFYAYYPYNATSIITAVDYNDGVAYITYSQPIKLDDMVDVMTASVIAARSDDYPTEDGKQIVFEFNHRLFAIGLTVVNAQTESKSDLVITAANIEFVGVNTSAQFNIAENDKYTALGFVNINHTYIDTETDTPITLNKPDNNNTLVSYNFNNGNEFLLIPCESLNIKVTLSVKNEWDEEVTYVIDDNFAPTNGKFFEAGKQYTITIKKSDNGITYERLINGWNNTDVEIEFN